MFKRIAMFMASLLIMGCVACVPPATEYAKNELQWWMDKPESLLLSEHKMPTSPDLPPRPEIVLPDSRANMPNPRQKDFDKALQKCQDDFMAAMKQAELDHDLAVKNWKRDCDAARAKYNEDFTAWVQLNSHFNILVLAEGQAPEVKPWVNGGHQLVYHWRESDRPLLGYIDNYGDYQPGHVASWGVTCTFFVNKDGIIKAAEKKRSGF